MVPETGPSHAKSNLHHFCWEPIRSIWLHVLDPPQKYTESNLISVWIQKGHWERTDRCFIFSWLVSSWPLDTFAFYVSPLWMGSSADQGYRDKVVSKSLSLTSSAGTTQGRCRACFPDCVPLKLRSTKLARIQNFSQHPELPQCRESNKPPCLFTPFPVSALHSAKPMSFGHSWRGQTFQNFSQ